MDGEGLSGARSKDVMAAGLALARLAERKPRSKRILEHALETLDRGHSRLAQFHAITAAQVIDGRRGANLEIALTAAEGSRRLQEASLEQARRSVPEALRDKVEALAEDSLRLVSEAEAMLRFMSTDRMLVEYGDRRFRLRSPLEVQVSRGPGAWMLEVARLGIHEYGATFAEAWDALNMDFCATWDDIALEADERLAPDARELKAVMLALVIEPRS
jgi:hypothetical protein